MYVFLKKHIKLTFMQIKPAETKMERERTDEVCVCPKITDFWFQVHG